MCFRPADASAGSGVNQCPECGKTIQAMGGITLKSCPFCKCDFTPYLDGTKPLPNAAPGAPAAPPAPRSRRRPPASRPTLGNRRSGPSLGMGGPAAPENHLPGGRAC